MLASHFSAIETLLRAQALVPANAGNPLHRGTPREVFIREFLAGHLSERVAIGSGEIIDAESKPREMRNQHDIVVYRRDFPKLDFGAGISGFLAESVIATIEVKSILDEVGVRQAVGAAKTAKALKRNVTKAFSVGYQPAGIVNLVVAYDGPERMSTVMKWLNRANQANAVERVVLPLDPKQRLATPSPALDGVFVLGKGFLHFDNQPISLVTQEHREKHPLLAWIWNENNDRNLFLLFLFLFATTASIPTTSLNPVPYLQSVRWNSSNWAADRVEIG